MNRRAFLLGTAAVALAPVAASRAVGFNPLLAAPYASGGFIVGDPYHAAKAIALARGYSCHPALARAMMERAALLLNCDYSVVEARVIAYETRALTLDSGHGRTDASHGNRPQGPCRDLRLSRKAERPVEATGGPLQFGSPHART